jgi:hypothetical protein
MIFSSQDPDTRKKFSHSSQTFGNHWSTALNDGMKSMKYIKENIGYMTRATVVEINNESKSIITIILFTSKKLKRRKKNLYILSVNTCI